MWVAPRAMRLVCWANAWLAGSVSLDDASDAVRGGDAAHHVLGLPGETEPIPLVLAFGAVRRLGAGGLHLALPVPGDPLGLAGPPEFTEAAVDAGEAAVGDGLGLVPDVVGAGVQWRAHPALPPAPLSLGEADAELTRVLLTTIDELTGLDLDRWQPEIADALQDLRGLGSSPGDLLPPGYSPRAQRLALRARRCLLIAELAGRGGDPLTTPAGPQATAALRGLDFAARRGLVAACAPPAGP